MLLNIFNSTISNVIDVLLTKAHISFTMELQLCLVSIRWIDHSAFSFDVDDRQSESLRKSKNDDPELHAVTFVVREQTYFWIYACERSTFHWVFYSRVCTPLYASETRYNAGCFINEQYGKITRWWAVQFVKQAWHALPNERFKEGNKQVISSLCLKPRDYAPCKWLEVVGQLASLLSPFRTKIRINAGKF